VFGAGVPPGEMRPANNGQNFQTAFSSRAADQRGRNLRALTRLGRRAWHHVSGASQGARVENVLVMPFLGMRQRRLGKVLPRGSAYHGRFIPQGGSMKICPVAIAVGCPKCPVFKVCPAKEIIGGYQEGAKKSATAARMPNPSKK
jgi:hypothetical protein